jgi:hypothetical protein
MHAFDTQYKDGAAALHMIRYPLEDFMAKVSQRFNAQETQQTAWALVNKDVQDAPTDSAGASDEKQYIGLHAWHTRKAESETSEGGSTTFLRREIANRIQAVVFKHFAEYLSSNETLEPSKRCNLYVEEDTAFDDSDDAPKKVEVIRRGEGAALSIETR